MQPWLGPDVCDHLRTLAAEGVKEVVVAPIGFVSDHMEIVYDLDVEARKVAQEIGVNLVRASTAGTHPGFVRMIRELMLERIENAPARFVGTHGARSGICATDCCRIS
jgi:ferrochelatase